MIPGHQLPVLSPLTLRGIRAGVFASPDALEALVQRVRVEYGVAGALLTSSGTVALALGMLAASPSGGRVRVALPAWACPDLLTAADAVDAEVLLYDLDPATLGPDLDSLRLVLNAEPHAVVVAHWFGLPVDLSGIATLVRAAGAQLIDDAAQGVGASVAGRPVGSAGEFGVLSFGRGKGRTGGSGGALLAMTGSAAVRAAQVGQQLQAAVTGRGALLSLLAQWGLGRPWAYALPAAVPSLHLGETLYHPAPELRLMSASAAAVVDAVWKLSEEEAVIRRGNAERWRQALTEVVGLECFGPGKSGVAGWLRYPVVADRRLARLLTELPARRCGAMPGYPRILNEWESPPGRFLPQTPAWPGARTLAQSLITLPTHRRLRRADISQIIGRVQSL